MDYGLTLNINEAMEEILEKSLEIERCGFDYIWVSDVPSQRYSLVVVSAIARRTRNVKIGFGLLSPFLHRPSHIANSLRTLIGLYGERFELCLGPGDLDQLRRVGITMSRRGGIANFLLTARKEIARDLCKDGLEVPVWLGAQGPRILKIAEHFGGVLLNYAHPDHIRWAIRESSLPEDLSIRLGIFAPSYVYLEGSEQQKMTNLLWYSSAAVALGANAKVLEAFNFYTKLKKAKEKLCTGVPVKDLMKDIPKEVLQKFAIHMPSKELPSYISKLEDLGISHIVFSYPQNHSKETIQTLAKATSLN